MSEKELKVVDVNELKELSELLMAIQVSAVTGVKVAADGKITFGDFKHLGELLGNFAILRDGVTGLKGLKVKELEGHELQELGTQTLDMIKTIVAVYKAEAGLE